MTQKTPSKINTFLLYILFLALSYFWASITYISLSLPFPKFFRTIELNHFTHPVLLTLTVLFLIIHIYFHRKNKTRLMFTIYEFLVLIPLPLWGFGINASLKHCAPCDTSLQALITPDVHGLMIFYYCCVIAYIIARKQKKVLSPILELLINGFLICGFLLCLSLTLHFNFNAILGVIFPFIGLPLAAPFVVMILFIMALIKRLNRIGKEHLQNSYNKNPSLSVITTLPILGAWFLIQKLIYSHWIWEIFTLSCERDFLFAMQRPPATDCHYLCTVAAQGSPRLVKPLRLGKRHGKTIIVNRQLQIANAFEDLLHKRSPRFGKFARQAYDKIGLPISHLITKPWQANLIYIVMKPFEWMFLLTLLILDSDPEKRIQRMYR